jgi:glutamate dehydrogenase (NAD(P)+)
MKNTPEAASPYCRTVELAGTDATGFVVIDSFLGGGGTGGIRMSRGVTQQEVADLAHEMSLKFAWLNIPRGGAKSGICCDHSVTETERKEILSSFGAAIADLLSDGRYVAGMDLGIGKTELETIMTAAGMKSGGDYQGDIDSNLFTALTVFSALQALVRERQQQIDTMSFLIEGAGKVGGHLMRLIDEAGGKVVGVSTIKGALIDPDGLDVARLLELKEQFGDACIEHMDGNVLASPADLYWQDADVLIPGARTNSITLDNVPRLRVRFIVPIANAVASEETELAMHDAGIAYLPGFVTNSGGIFCWYIARLNADARENMIRLGFGNKVAALVAMADRKNMSIAALARRQAKAKASQMLAETNGPPSARIVGTLRKLSPRRILFIVLGKILGKQWSKKDTAPCRWYYDAKYFS